jgi:hypothetical protein
LSDSDHCLSCPEHDRSPGFVDLCHLNYFGAGTRVHAAHGLTPDWSDDVVVSAAVDLERNDTNQPMPD